MELISPNCMLLYINSLVFYLFGDGVEVCEIVIAKIVYGRQLVLFNSNFFYKISLNTVLRKQPCTYKNKKIIDDFHMILKSTKINLFLSNFIFTVKRL